MDLWDNIPNVTNSSDENGENKMNVENMNEVNRLAGMLASGAITGEFFRSEVARLTSKPVKLTKEQKAEIKAENDLIKAQYIDGAEIKDGKASVKAFKSLVKDDTKCRIHLGGDKALRRSFASAGLLIDTSDAVNAVSVPMEGKVKVLTGKAAMHLASKLSELEALKEQSGTNSSKYREAVKAIKALKAA